MSLEVMAVAVGLATFAEELKGRKVVVYIDNTAAEVHAACLLWPCLHRLVCLMFAQASTERGSARCEVHNALVHKIWSMAAVFDIALWVE